jgi:hypothetical protein
LTLFAASVALVALLIASYGTRRTLLACLSVGLSAALVAAAVFLATTETPAQGRARLAWFASKLPVEVDRQAIAALTASLERLVTSAAQKPAVAEDPRPVPVSRPAMQAAATPSWFGAPSKPKAEAKSPVVWFLDDPNAPVVSPIEDGFAIGGVNTSAEDLKQVHATLKPDGARREIELTLKVEGHVAEAGDAVIPAGARFSFGSATPQARRSEPSGGAILTFRYVTAGQQRAAIVYINAATLARFASRE